MPGERLRQEDDVGVGHALELVGDLDVEGRGVETADIERVDGGETFFWRGHYEHDLNVAHTDDTRLNVFGEFRPQVPAHFQDSKYVFLGNSQTPSIGGDPVDSTVGVFDSEAYNSAAVTL